MTVGDGIFWSTVLVLLAVAAFQTTARRKWKSVAKVLMGLLGLAVAVAAGLWGWNTYKQRPRPIDELSGVRLGMAPLDVKLRKGEPQAQTTPEQAENEYSMGWIFKDGDYGPVVAVRFYGSTPTTLTASIICEQEGSAAVLGLSRYSSEESVLEKLGKPSSISIRADGLEKTISFDQYKLAFKIAKGSVTSVCVTASGGITYKDEYQETGPSSATPSPSAIPE